MKRKNIVGIAAAGFLLFTGCSGNRQETTEYDWIPPVEGVSWGQEKEEVLQAIGVSEEDTEVLGGEAEGTVEMVILQEPLSFLGEKAQTTLSFEPGGGLVSITFAFEKDDVITELIPRIKEAYPSETGGTSTSIYGSVPEQMEEAATEKYKEYLKKQGMEENRIQEYIKLPLVMIDWNTESESPFYNTCVWTGTRAAMWENAMEQES